MDTFLLSKILTPFVLPPGINLALALTGGLMLRHFRRTGVGLICFSLISLCVMSLPIAADRAAQYIEAYPALSPAELSRAKPGAIVVLAGGWRSAANAAEYGEDTVNDSSLRRARYTAYLHRGTGLPVLVSGGRVLAKDPVIAPLIARLLVDEFSVPVRWTEARSRNTEENALYSSEILRSAGIKHIALVTDALHMRRAVESFARVGMEAIPVPTAFLVSKNPEETDIFDWLPSIGALKKSHSVLYELLGRYWYRLRY